jgi:hypothetical protein
MLLLSRLGWALETCAENFPCHQRMPVSNLYATSMDFDVASVEGEAQLQAYMQVQQVPNDTDPLMWWKQLQQEFPDLTRMARQYLTVPTTSASPERFFSRVGLVQTDFRGRLLDTTMIDLMWDKQAP